MVSQYTTVVIEDNNGKELIIDESLADTVEYLLDNNISIINASQGGSPNNPDFDIDTLSTYAKKNASVKPGFIEIEDAEGELFTQLRLSILDNDDRFVLWREKIKNKSGIYGLRWDNRKTTTLTWHGQDLEKAITMLNKLH